MVGRGLAILALVVWCDVAHGEGPVVSSRSAREIGRAGVGTISDDGGGALLVNPAAIARRDSTRMQFGLAFVDDEMSWLVSPSAPIARDQSSSRLLPLVAFEAAIGCWMLGATATTSAHSARALRRPDTLPPSDLGNTFEYRYTGMSGSFRRDTVALGGARRIGDTVAVGVAVAASRVAITESRRLWAGLAGRGDPDELIGDPRYDVELALAATDDFDPSAVAGVLVAPEGSQVELAASLGWAAPARARGEVVSIPIAPQPPLTLPTVNAGTGSRPAQLDVDAPITLRTGARYLGERWAVEVGGDLWLFSSRAETTTWRLTDMQLIDTTTLGSPRAAQLGELPSRLSSRTHGALRASLDVELIAGFLWATGGYAFTTAATPRARLSPTFGDLGGHTLALGLETTAGGFTVTLGWARTWSLEQLQQVSRWSLDNPFGTGDAAVASGTYDGSTDMIGISVDVDLVSN